MNPTLSSASSEILNQSLGKLPSGVYRWTRKGLLSFPWTPGESLDHLVLSPPLRERLQDEATRFGDGLSAFHSLRLPWRRGAFFFGAPGVGKTAASRGLAKALGWAHLTLPAHEILNAHLLERALAELTRYTRVVIVLEDVERVISRMETEDFFTILDHALERSEGVYWVATSRHPEQVPKTQLIRPGRFDSSIRLDAPNSALRRELIRSQLLPLLLTLPRAPDLFSSLPPEPPSPAPEPGELELEELTVRTDHFGFAHFEELRSLCAGLLLAGRDSEVWPEVLQFIQDQVISGDRFGGLSDETERLRARVDEVDPRILLAALDQTDVFKALIEKVIGDAAERSALEGDGEAGL